MRSPALTLLVVGCAIFASASASARAGAPPPGESPAAAPPADAAAAAVGDAPGDALPSAARAAVTPTAALLEKLGRGDRLALEGDHRNALFAYQDAVYMQPGYAPAHVKLGRAYLTLRYPAQAAAQAEAALAADPGSADARALLEDANAASRPQPAPEPASSTTGRRSFRLAPGSAIAPAPPAAAGPPGPPPAR